VYRLSVCSVHVVWPTVTTYDALNYLCNVVLLCTAVVFTLGNGVNGFTLDEQIGEFILTHPNIKIPNRGKVSCATVL
jgi:hypothetical protein